MCTRSDLDLRLRDRIVHAVETLPVDAASIGVSVTDGAVTLCGELDDHPRKAALLDRVFEVDGVDCLVDRVSVTRRAWDRPDEDIARDLGHALRDDELVPAHSVRAIVRDGVVTLTGLVAWDHQRDDAARAARRVSGVRAVQNSVRVDAGPLSLSPIG